MNNAGWNQKMNLIIWAGDYKFPKLKEELNAREITKQPMSYDRYKRIRNAIFGNNADLALKLIQRYPRNESK